jgi:hypothetical protein
MCENSQTHEESDASCGRGRCAFAHIPASRRQPTAKIGTPPLVRPPNEFAATLIVLHLVSEPHREGVRPAISPPRERTILRRFAMGPRVASPAPSSRALMQRLTRSPPSLTSFSARCLGVDEHDSHYDGRDADATKRRNLFVEDEPSANGDRYINDCGHYKGAR